MHVVKRKYVFFLVATIILLISIFVLIQSKETYNVVTNSPEDAFVMNNDSVIDRIDRAKSAYEDLKSTADTVGNEVSVTYYFPSGETVTFPESPGKRP